MSEAQPAQFRVLIWTGAFEPGFRAGGPIRSLAGIVDSLPTDIEVHVITRDRDLGSAEPYPGLSGKWVQRGRAIVLYLDTRSVRQWVEAVAMLHRARYELLYVNSLWSPIFTVIPILARAVRVIGAKAILIAPRGELSPGALSLKARKKAIAIHLWGGMLRRLGVTWHATSEGEAGHIRAIFPWAQVVINQSQAALPLSPIAPLGGESGEVRLVFIGRIVPKKNLSLTLMALQHADTPIVFDIFGPIEDVDYWSFCQSLMARLPKQVMARYQGELQPFKVRATFAAYDAFVFPTLGENFGHVIAESLSASCPVVCSEDTPWSATLRTGGGAVVAPLSVDNLRAALERIARMTPRDRMGAREEAGRAYLAWRKTAAGPNILEQVSRCA